MGLRILYRYWPAPNVRFYQLKGTYKCFSILVRLDPWTGFMELTYNVGSNHMIVTSNFNSSYKSKCFNYLIHTVKSISVMSYYLNTKNTFTKIISWPLTVSKEVNCPINLLTKYFASRHSNSWHDVNNQNEMYLASQELFH